MFDQTHRQPSFLPSSVSLFLTLSFFAHFLFFFYSLCFSPTWGRWALRLEMTVSPHYGEPRRCLSNFYITDMNLFRYNTGIQQQMHLLKCLFGQQREIGIVNLCSFHPEIDTYIWLIKLLQGSTFFYSHSDYSDTEMQNVSFHIFRFFFMYKPIFFKKRKKVWFLFFH